MKVLGKLSDVEKRESGDKDYVRESPTFGFKENLIQMLTNLVWDHTENKTTVGELDGLALILDCSQMDARNPLITQRVGLAVRALTTDHSVNQEILAGLKKIGAADGDLLKELALKYGYKDIEQLDKVCNWLKNGAEIGRKHINGFRNS